jgi:hypothetical protein
MELPPQKRGRLYNGNLRISSGEWEQTGEFLSFWQRLAAFDIRSTPALTVVVPPVQSKTTAGGELLWGVGGWSEVQPRVLGSMSHPEGVPWNRLYRLGTTVVYDLRSPPAFI